MTTVRTELASCSHLATSYAHTKKPWFFFKADIEDKNTSKETPTA